MSLLQSLLHSHITSFDSLLLQTSVPAVATCFAIQNAVGIPSVVAQTEHVYDLSGGVTFVVASAVSLLSRVWASPASRTLDLANFNWRQLAMTGATIIYATRLASYLYTRILKRGEDSRFRGVRKQPRRFLFFWQAQAVWVSMSLLPSMLVNAIPASVFGGLPAWTRITDVLGFSMWAAGFLFECISDWQKSRWLDEKRAKVHDEQFITRGLFSRRLALLIWASRYPSYFGDVLLWTGMATVAAGVLVAEPVPTALRLSGGWLSRLSLAALPFLSPAFVAFLFFKVSGIPLSETKYDKLYGNNTEYRLWKQNTPLFFPRLF